MSPDVLAVQPKETLCPTVSVKVAVPVPAALVALIVTVDVPPEVGAPEIKPVPLSTDRPAGKPVALKLVGEPTAAV